MSNNVLTGKIGALSRHRGPDDPEVIDLRVELAQEHIRAVIDALPPLTDEHRRKLAALLVPVGDKAEGAA